MTRTEGKMVTGFLVVVLTLGLLTAAAEGDGARQVKEIQPAKVVRQDKFYKAMSTTEIQAYIDNLHRKTAEYSLSVEENQRQQDIRIEQERIARLLPVNVAMWEALHNCEQPGNWFANGGNPGDPAGQTFQGGLGMSTDAWRLGVAAAAARGVSLPASALAATPHQQMQGAQAFYDAHGWGWACHV